MNHNHEHHHNHRVSEHQNHDKHSGHSPEMFKNKFWWSLILTIPTVLYSEMIQHWLGFTMPTFPGSEYLPFILGTILFFYSGTVFLKGAVAEIRSKQIGMMTLIAMAIIVAFIYSLIVTFTIQGTDFWWELATLITIMIFGHWMEMKSIQNAQNALHELAKLLPDTAELISGEIVPLSKLQINDIVLVKPGEKIPADGMITKGSSQVNESMITGESNLVSKASGDSVIAGTINANGALEIQVTQIGEKTVLAGVMKLVKQAQASKSRAQILADKAAYYLTILAAISGAVTLTAWLLSGSSIAFAIDRTVTVLIIACPHALGLAIPLVTSISTSLAAKNGLLIKNRLGLESARNIDVVLFDKTGTLTTGQHGIANIWPEQGYTELGVVQIASSLEKNSEHAIAQAFAQKTSELKLTLQSVEEFQTLPGKGITGIINGIKYQIGNKTTLNSEPSSDLKNKLADAGASGKTVIYLSSESKLIAAFATADMIRQEAKATVDQLLKDGRRVAMLTGDSKEVAQYVAKTLSITDVFAEVLPQDKVEKVKHLQRDGSKVAMIGDGINDAPALTQADLGVAIGAGTDVAIESADIILAQNNPEDILKIIRLSSASYNKMLQNLIWATGYNIVAIPLAAGLFGIILPASIGAILMSASTIIVALNAQLLRKFKF